MLEVGTINNNEDNDVEKTVGVVVAKKERHVHNSIIIIRESILKRYLLYRFIMVSVSGQTADTVELQGNRKFEHNKHGVAWGSVGPLPGTSPLSHYHVIDGRLWWNLWIYWEKIYMYIHTVHMQYILC